MEEARAAAERGLRSTVAMSPDSLSITLELPVTDAVASARAEGRRDTSRDARVDESLGVGAGSTSRAGTSAAVRSRDGSGLVPGLREPKAWR